jgi:hypothetical protein
MSKNQLMIDKVCSAMLYNWRITIRDFSDELGLLFGVVQSILAEDLGMNCVSVKFVPKLLTIESYLIQNFLAEHQISCHSTPIHWTWSRVTFFYSQI